MASELTPQQRVRAARERQQAQARRAALQAQTPRQQGFATAAVSPTVAALQGSQPAAASAAGGAAKRSKRASEYFRDTQAGFLMPPEKDPVETETASKPDNLHRDPGHHELSTYPEDPRCQDCKQEFTISYLHTHFGLQVCNNCRKIHRDGKYRLVTKSTAKDEYLLRDSELSGRDGGLRFVERENPNGELWSKMKLYLLCQVQEAAYARYGGPAGLDAEHDRRDQVQQNHKMRRHSETIRKMRKQTLTSTWLEKRADHTHEYPPGDGRYDAETDTYTKTCTSCGFEYSYEKM